MTIFIVCRVQDPLKMKASIESHYPDNHMDIGNNEWLISAKSTAKEVSDKLCITGGELAMAQHPGRAIIFRIENYFGLAPTDIWEWIKTKTEATNG
jgi:hypothetical protein